MNKQYKHKITKDVVDFRSDSDCYYFGANQARTYFLPKTIVENSLDWEEVISKDYEILTLIGNSNNESYKDQIIQCIGSNKKEPNSHWDIHSIKRLSDSEIFTIGDKTKKGFITYFKTLDNILYAGYHENGGNQSEELKYITIHKQPLFTTEDGVEIFDSEDTYYSIMQDLKLTGPHFGGNKDFNLNSPRVLKRFSTKQACQDYLDNIHNTPKQEVKQDELITVKLTKEKYDLLMQLLEE